MKSISSVLKISVAPMMGYTDRHARYLFRLISPHVQLYTEMVIAKALLHGNRSKLLGFNEEEHSLVLQLGGSDPDEMAKAAVLAEEAGYDEININIGCPSDRVQSGEFGACLMARPVLVAEIYSAMQNAVKIPVTIKHRIGIDDQDSFADLEKFITQVSKAGCSKFIVHARKAWLKGLSPKQNRVVPPLDYGRVYRLKVEHPKLKIIVNGGIKNTNEVYDHLAHADGVMIGREVFNQPWMLSELEQLIYPGQDELFSRDEVRRRYSRYIEEELQKGTSAHLLAKPIAGLFHGKKGARAWRRLLTETVHNRTDHLARVVAEFNP